MSKAYENVKALVEKYQNIVITTHAGPDADGIGSEVALCIALRSLGKNVICVNEEPLLERYQYLSPGQVVIGFEQYHPQEPIELFIVVDTNNSSRIGLRMASLLRKSQNVLFIDHHPCPPEMTNLHCIDTTAAATGQVVGELTEYLGIALNQAIALPLYTAILIDTSSFRYPTVSWKTHTLIAKLLKTGVEPPRAYNMIYGAKKISHMQLLGKVLADAQINNSGEIAWISLSDHMLNQHQANIEDTHSFINHLLILNNVKVACMFRKNDKHIKISLRSAGDIDVGVIAQALGGGGHNHSAATVVEGEMDRIILNTIERIEKILKIS